MKKHIALIFLSLLGMLKSQEELCPSPDAIIPCTCETSDDRPSLRCTNIDDDDQLEQIFMADFPDSSIEFFTLTDSNLTEISRNIFQNITFEQVFVTNSPVDSISADAFENSEETLLNLEFELCPVTSESFPFASLERYTSLVQFSMKNSLINEFPAIISNSLIAMFIQYNYDVTSLPAQVVAGTPQLTKLDLQGCGIVTIDNDAFQEAEQLEYLSFLYNSLTAVNRLHFSNLPNLEELNLSNNNISEMDIDTFANLPVLRRLDLRANRFPTFPSTTFENNPLLDYLALAFNDLPRIEPGSFITNTMLTFLNIGDNSLTRIESGTFDGLNATEISLSLSSNSIEFVDVDAFGGVSNSYISFDSNELTEISEYWARPLLDAANYVYVHGNPFECDCAMQWVLDDPEYVYRLSGVCSNANNASIWYLNETIFEDC